RRTTPIRRVGVALALVATAGTAGGVLISSSGSAKGPIVNGFEMPTVADTAYPIPAAALFVANGGADTNPGTQSAPVATIGHARGKAPGGATIVVRGGTYREAPGSIVRRVTIQAYPHETVWLKGSVPVTGFAASSGYWVRSGWTTALCHTCFAAAAIDPNY